MFRPFIGEVLVGKISGYDEKGLQGDLVIFSLAFCLLIGLQPAVTPFSIHAYFFVEICAVSANYSEY